MFHSYRFYLFFFFIEIILTCIVRIGFLSLKYESQLSKNKSNFESLSSTELQFNRINIASQSDLFLF